MQLAPNTSLGVDNGTSDKSTDVQPQNEAEHRDHEIGHSENPKKLSTFVRTQNDITRPMLKYDLERH